MKIKKGFLADVSKFLDNLELTGKASIGRTELKKKIEKVSTEVTELQKEIIEEYDSWIDEEQGTFKQDVPEMIEAMDQLLNGEVVIDAHGDFSTDLSEALLEYNKPLKGIDAEIYSLMYLGLQNKEEK